MARDAANSNKACYPTFFNLVVGLRGEWALSASEKISKCSTVSQYDDRKLHLTFKWLHMTFPAPPTRSTRLLCHEQMMTALQWWMGEGHDAYRRARANFATAQSPERGWQRGVPRSAALPCYVALFMCALGLACTVQSTMHMICGCSLGSIEYNRKFFAEQWPSNHHQGIVEYGLSEHFITLSQSIMSGWWGWICSCCISWSLVGC
jgi:hypothetical protein